jgi:predicted nucleic acid-binding protein
VIGEIALENLRQRDEVLGALDRLPSASIATFPEVRRLVEEWELFGLGIGWVDACLIASVKLTADTKLWTRDKRLILGAEKAEASMWR